MPYIPDASVLRSCLFLLLEATHSPPHRAPSLLPLPELCEQPACPPRPKFETAQQPKDSMFMKLEEGRFVSVCPCLGYILQRHEQPTKVPYVACEQGRQRKQFESSVTHVVHKPIKMEKSADPSAFGSFPLIATWVHAKTPTKLAGTNLCHGRADGV